VLAACHGIAPERPPPPNRIVPPSPPRDVMSIPNAVPRVEPRSAYGNPPFYDVFGKRYFVRQHCRGYDKRGVASWYGPGFYEEETSTHEPYDMYAMTAAHRTLPLPCFVRVTNLQNGRSVIVRVNDRGPFVKNRIIDLSYTAAAKLGMLRTGTAMVDVQSLDPRAPAAPVTSTPSLVASAPPGSAPSGSAPPGTTPPGPAPPGPAPPGPAPPGPAPSPATLYIQTGAFADPANAERLLSKLRDNGYPDAFVRDAMVGGRRLYRVRIGPVRSVDDYDRIVDGLERIGVSGARLAPN
jgi:peptidoglycan lytic transglycosylase